jgi:hypothetical protein
MICLFTGINVNRKWKMIELGLVNTLVHMYNLLWEDLLPEQSHARARATADTGRILPDSEFKMLLVK